MSSLKIPTLFAYSLLFARFLPFQYFVSGIHVTPCHLLIFQERRNINKEIEHFRQQYQRAEQRRDFDLYDPTALKKGDVDLSFEAGFGQK